MSTEDKNQSLAEERTEWAEDRTLLANERTFAGWMRTGLATCALGLGFHAIFSKVEPTWMAKSAATLFIGIGIMIFGSAYRSSVRVRNRLNAHAAEPLEGSNLGLIAMLLAMASIALALLLWFL